MEMSEFPVESFRDLSIRVRDLVVMGFTFHDASVTSDGWPEARIAAVVTEEEVNSLLRRVNVDSYFIEPTVSLKGGFIWVTGSVDTGGHIVDVGSAVGSIKVEEGRIFYFVPNLIKLRSLTVIGPLVKLVKSIMMRNPLYQFEEELPLRVESVTVEKGRLKVEGLIRLDRLVESLGSSQNEEYEYEYEEEEEEEDSEVELTE